MSKLLKFKRLDVRPLLEKGIEPFPTVRKRVDDLKPGEGLMLVAPFLPSPLIEILRSEGLQARIERGKSGEWIVYFQPEEETR